MKNIVVTGSSKGIGLGLATEFLKRGCNVMLSSYAPNELDAVHADAQKTYGAEHVGALACDVTNLSQVQALWDTAQQTFGSVDIWMNNAGIANTTRPFWELDAVEIPRVVSTNLVGVMYGTQVALKGMRGQGSGAIYNSEGFGSNDMFVRGLCVYGSTKRGLRYFTEALAEEAKELPVVVGTISPGIVLTDFLIDDMRKMDPELLETTKTVYNCLVDTVDIVTNFLVTEVLANTENGRRIEWLTDEKAAARFEDPTYYERDLFSQFGL